MRRTRPRSVRPAPRRSRRPRPTPRDAARPTPTAAPRPPRERGASTTPASDVAVPHGERGLLGELAARLHLLAHEDREDALRLDDVLVRHAQQCAGLGVHRRLPELVRIHLAEALVALDHDVLLAQARDCLVALL